MSFSRFADLPDQFARWFNDSFLGAGGFLGDFLAVLVGLLAGLFGVIRTHWEFLLPFVVLYAGYRCLRSGLERRPMNARIYGQRFRRQSVSREWAAMASGTVLFLFAAGLFLRESGPALAWVPTVAAGFGLVVLAYALLPRFETPSPDVPTDPADLCRQSGHLRSQETRSCRRCGADLSDARYDDPLFGIEETLIPEPGVDWDIQRRLAQRWGAAALALAGIVIVMVSLSGFRKRVLDYQPVYLEERRGAVEALDREIYGTLQAFEALLEEPEELPEQALGPTP